MQAKDSVAEEMEGQVLSLLDLLQNPLGKSEEREWVKEFQRQSRCPSHISGGSQMIKCITEQSYLYSVEETGSSNLNHPSLGAEVVSILCITNANKFMRSATSTLDLSVRMSDQTTQVISLQQYTSLYH